MDDPPDTSPLPGITVDGAPSAAGSDELRTVAARALALLGVSSDAHLAITLVEPEQMAALKERALGVREATDVLAWPMDPVAAGPGPFVVGDVVLCPAVAVEQARAAGHSVDEEIALLLVHGILHCLGWDHADHDEERAMFSEQDRVLRAIGVTVA